MIEFVNTTNFKISPKKIAALGEAFLKKYQPVRRDVSVAVIGDQKMRRLNHVYRGLDKPTDVLSFTAPATVPNLLGEIVIDPREIERLSKYKEILEFTGWSYPPRARRQALDYLVYFIFIHGLLHLVGYDDAKETERQTMLRLGRDFLKRQGISGIM